MNKPGTALKLNIEQLFKEEGIEATAEAIEILQRVADNEAGVPYFDITSLDGIIGLGPELPEDDEVPKPRESAA